MHRVVPRQLPVHRFRTEPWCLTERGFDHVDTGLTETLFALGNGYLGLRGDHEEDRGAHDPGAFVNGFHETWSIHHAEDAFGFATIGQTIVNVPDGKIVSLYVDDEPLELAVADLVSYERQLDLRRGTLVRDLVWRTPHGKRVRVRSERLVSLTRPHVAALRYDVTMESGDAEVVLRSRLLNREAEGGHAIAPLVADDDHQSGPVNDPRRSRAFSHRVLRPRLHTHRDDQVTLGFQCANSGMSIACAVRHHIEAQLDPLVAVEVGPHEGRVEISTPMCEGESLRLVKYLAYHTSRYSPPHDGHVVVDDVDELATRCTRSLDRVVHDGFVGLVDDQQRWLQRFWAASDVEIVGRPEGDVDRALADQQAMRWNLFQLAQASAQTGENGIAAKGVTAGGYEGHYFWDMEMYVAPFLSYTRPEAARQLLRFRWHMLPTARHRARALSQIGALYPWRTINGEEASAYYAAGTAQYHINAAIALALKRYVDASGDVEFLATDGAEILVETARLWEDLGFYSTRQGPLTTPTFHIHGVTGPDEYTAVVNDNLYTNVMARFNMRYASRVLELLAEVAPDALNDLERRVELAPDEHDRWVRASESMFLPYDEELGIHPQDIDFLTRERWDFARTPKSMYPLLLHFHPLVIYRHQVLKQADVVLAMSLRKDQFPLGVRRRNFDYYDPITTGDSSLSACVQATAAAQIGYDNLAVDYFREALYVDLADLHGNTADGVHVASCGGVWGTVVFGFAGVFETGTALSFEPSLPDAWESISFHMQRHGSRMRVELDADGCTVHVLDGEPVPIHARPGETGPLLDPQLRPTDDVGDGSGPDRVDGIVLVPSGGRLRVPKAVYPPH